jgi:hypothetical protein
MSAGATATPGAQPGAAQPGAGGGAPAAQPGAQPGAGGGAAQPSAADLQKQIDTLKTQNADATRAAEFWHKKATEAAAPAGDKKEPAEEEVDLLDLIASKGEKGFAAYLKSKGYTSREEVDGLVTAKATQIAKEGELLGRYPDLKKQDSDFFKATAAEYGALKQQGVPEAQAMEIAAERVELRFLREGKLKTTQQQTDDEKARKEQERLARVRAQGGDTGGRSTEPEEGDETITPEEERIIRGMLVGQPGKDGKPMNYEQAEAVFKERAKAGVRVSTRTRK